MAAEFPAGNFPAVKFPATVKYRLTCCKVTSCSNILFKTLSKRSNQCRSDYISASVTSTKIDHFILDFLFVQLALKVVPG